MGRRLRVQLRKDSAAVRNAPIVATFAVLLVGFAVLASVGHAHYPVHHWLFWRFAGYWIASGVWAFACFSAGCRVVRKLNLALPTAEFMLTSFAIGVLIFFFGMFAAGMANMLFAPFALAWPAVLCLVGGRRPLRYPRRFWTVMVQTRSLPLPRLLVAAFGLVGVAMVYFSIVSPNNLGFDARWYHLPVAEHYVAAGGIVPFEEGWYLGAYPHLASIVYTWAFLLPGTELLDRVLLAAHLEFVLFLATLASVPILVRTLIGGPLRWESFAAVFLFPSVFLYDGALFVAADHVLAFFAIPIYLWMRRAAKDPTCKCLSVLTALMAGALLTKYQAVYLLVPAACVVLWTCLRAFRHSLLETRRIAWGATVSLALGLVLTAPHWLCNWSWYGDPLYPMLHRYGRDRPFSESAANHLDTFFGTDLWVPTGSMGTKLVDTMRALVSFSFEPHDWATYHGSVPIFGSLFTILSFAAPFAFANRRVLALIGTTLTGIAVWFLTSHQDRYLQALLPYMAVVTFAMALLIHRRSRFLRAPLWALIGLQVAWGADVYFIPANDDSYEVDRPSPIKAAVDLISSGYRGEYESRLHPFQPWEAIGASLPRGAKVLLHERYLHLGLGRMSATDLPGWQGGIAYDELRDSKAVAERLRSFGITHVLWERTTSHERDSLAGDVAFFRFATRWSEEPRSIGPFVIARVPASLPPAENGEIAWYACPPGPGQLRRLGDLGSDVEQAPIGGRFVAVPPPAEVELAIVDRACHSGPLGPDWDLAMNRGPYALWIRKPSPRPKGEK